MRTLVVFLLLHLANHAGLQAADLRDQPFDQDWLFWRGDANGAEQPAFDDSSWRRLDLPHDWSIEDRPRESRASAPLEVVKGKWRFQEGDDPGWSAAGYDDAEWQLVPLPATWERHSNLYQDNAYGWFRRRFDVPRDLRGKDLQLLLGRIDDVDEVWLNGHRIGGSGSFPPNYQSAWDVDRRYRAPASLLRADSPNVLAIRVFDGEGDGGVYAQGVDQSPVGPFDPAASQNGHFTGYTVGGVGWYRKKFVLEEPNQRVALRFDGVYQQAEVWLNGQRLGEHTHGYTGFEFDLTPHLAPPGLENVVAVRVLNEGRNSRWYSGSGIYRHVWLTVTEPLHVPTWGVFVTTPEVSERQAKVNVAIEVENSSHQNEQARVRVTLRGPDGKAQGSGEGVEDLGPAESKTVQCELLSAAPRLWSCESPELYSAEVELLVGDKVVDSLSTPFGIRSIRFDSEQGFLLNGKPLLLRGGCIHHDNGPLGAAAFDRAEVRKIELLKSNGFNAIRSAHNPPSLALLEACDRLGMLVIDEVFDQWNQSKENNAQDNHRFFNDWHERDIASMVRRDRNHPSVIMWSIGNEIPEQFRAEETQLTLRRAVLKHDVTRPITQAICTDWGEVIQNWDGLSDPAFKHLDVAGYNYLPDKYATDHRRHPERMMYGSESYPRDALEYWSLVEKHPYVIGDFVWTAMDYLGESGIAHAVRGGDPNPFFMSWPWHNAWCGDLDLCGFKKPQSYYRDVVWRRSPIEMAVHEPLPEGQSEVLSWWAWPEEHRSWNWAGHEGKTLEVSVYSRCEVIRLELNGKVIDEKRVSSAQSITTKFAVPYQPGELRAVGLIEGAAVAEISFETTGPPKSIRLIADREALRLDRQDLCYVKVEVIDAQGRRVPNANTPIAFVVTGAGKLVGQASGAPNRPASFQAPHCVTYRGQCLAIVQPSSEVGKFTLRASSGQLEPAELQIGRLQ